MNSLQMESIKAVIETLSSDQKTEVIKHIYMCHDMVIRSPTHLVIEDAFSRSGIRCSYRDKGKYRIDLDDFNIEFKIVKHGKTIYHDVYGSVNMIRGVEIYYNISRNRFKPRGHARIYVYGIHTLKDLVNFIEFTGKYKLVISSLIYKFIARETSNFHKGYDNIYLSLNNYRTLVES